jgi:site-specific recombinase XerD
MRYCRQGERKFELEINRARLRYGKRNLRFVRSNEVLYWRFLAHLQDIGYRPRTVERYHEKLRTFLRWLEGRSLRRVKREQVERFLLWYKQERIRTPYTLRYLREALAVFFGFLMTHAGLRRNPAVGLRIRTHYPQSERLHLFSPEETRSLLETARDELRRLAREDYPTEGAYRRCRHTVLQDYLILKLLFSTGIRPCEIASLRREDLDEQRLRLRLRTKGRQQYIVSERNVFLTPRTLVELKTLLLAGDERRGPLADGRLFFDYYARIPLSAGYPNKIVKRWAARCGIARNVYAYMCRYTYCTRLVENGVDPYSLKKLMGHKQMATSLVHYLKLTPAELRREWREFNPLASGGAV